jgi:hypothetical protein
MINLVKIMRFFVFTILCKTSITVLIAASMIENSEPKPSASIIKKNKILKTGAAPPIRLKPSGYTTNASSGPCAATSEKSFAHFTMYMWPNTLKTANPSKQTKTFYVYVSWFLMNYCSYLHKSQ